jgi:hypothetical protein
VRGLLRGVRDKAEAGAETAQTMYRLQFACAEIYNRSLFDLVSLPTGTSAQQAAAANAQAAAVSGDAAGAGGDRTLVSTVGGTASIEKLQWHDIDVRAGHDEEASMQAAQTLLMRANAARTSAATAGNTDSSRSHVLYLFRVLSVSVADGASREALLSICDLAGSESLDTRTQDRPGSATAQLSRDSETKAINSSLHTLTRVVHAYATAPPGQRPSHVPYRESLLTMLLRDSIGGNCRTAILVTLGTDEEQLPHSYKSCGFARLARGVRNCARENKTYDPASLVASLTAQVEDLQDQLAKRDAEISALQSDLAGVEARESCSAGPEDLRLSQLLALTEGPADEEDETNAMATGSSGGNAALYAALERWVRRIAASPSLSRGFDSAPIATDGLLGDGEGALRGRVSDVIDPTEFLMHRMAQVAAVAQTLSNLVKATGVPTVLDGPQLYSVGVATSPARVLADGTDMDSLELQTPVRRATAAGVAAETNASPTLLKRAFVGYSDADKEALAEEAARTLAQRCTHWVEEIRMKAIPMLQKLLVSIDGTVDSGAADDAETSAKGLLSVKPSSPPTIEDASLAASVAELERTRDAEAVRFFVEYLQTEASVAERRAAAFRSDPVPPAAVINSSIAFIAPLVHAGVAIQPAPGAAPDSQLLSPGGTLAPWGGAGGTWSKEQAQVALAMGRAANMGWQSPLGNLGNAASLAASRRGSAFVSALAAAGGAIPAVANAPLAAESKLASSRNLGTFAAGLADAPKIAPVPPMATVDWQMWTPCPCARARASGDTLSDDAKASCTNCPGSWVTVSQAVTDALNTALSAFEPSVVVLDSQGNPTVEPTSKAGQIFSRHMGLKRPCQEALIASDKLTSAFMTSQVGLDGLPSFVTSVIDPRQCMQTCLVTGAACSVRRLVHCLLEGDLQKRTRILGKWVWRTFRLTPAGIYQLHPYSDRKTLISAALAELPPSAGSDAKRHASCNSGVSGVRATFRDAAVTAEVNKKSEIDGHEFVVTVRSKNGKWKNQSYVASSSHEALLWTRAISDAAAGKFSTDSSPGVYSPIPGVAGNLGADAADSVARSTVLESSIVSRIVGAHLHANKLMASTSAEALKQAADEAEVRWNEGLPEALATLQTRFWSAGMGEGPAGVTALVPVTSSTEADSEHLTLIHPIVTESANSDGARSIACALGFTSYAITVLRSVRIQNRVLLRRFYEVVAARRVFSVGPIVVGTAYMIPSSTAEVQRILACGVAGKEQVHGLSATPTLAVDAHARKLSQAKGQLGSTKLGKPATTFCMIGVRVAYSIAGLDAFYDEPAAADASGSTGFRTPSGKPRQRARFAASASRHTTAFAAGELPTFKETMAKLGASCVLCAYPMYALWMRVDTTGLAK